MRLVKHDTAPNPSCLFFCALCLILAGTSYHVSRNLALVQYLPPSRLSVSQLLGAFVDEDLITQPGQKLGADLRLASLLSVLSRGFSKPTCPTVLVCLLKL